MVRFIKAAADEVVRRVASKMEPAIRDAFLRAVAALKSSISLDALAAAIEGGDADQAIAVLGLSGRFARILSGVGVEAGIRSFRDALRETFVESAAANALVIPAGGALHTAFDLMNPEVIAFLDAYTFPLIREIGKETEDALREVMVEAFSQGGHPREQARKIKGFVGLTRHQSQAVRSYRNALLDHRTMGSTLDRKLRDARFDPTVLRSIRHTAPLPMGHVDRMTTRYQDRFTAHRALTIARTESIRASTQGQRALWAQARQRGLIEPDMRRRWVASMDDATCPVCMSLDGEERGLDEPFMPGVMDPPDPHPTCRCSVVLVTAAEKRAA